MSARLSTGLPRACSGDMYAAVPMITPICVAAPVSVGDCDGSPSGVVSSALANPKSRTLTVPSSRTLMFAGFRSRWITPASWAALQRLRDLSSNRQRVFEWHRAMRDTVGEGRPFDQLQDERQRVIRRLNPVDGSDARVVQTGQDVRFPLEPGEAVGVSGEGVGQNLQRDIAAELRVCRAIDLPHPPFADEGGHIVMAEAVTDGEGHETLPYAARSLGFTRRWMRLPASFSATRSSKVFCRFSQSSGVVPRYRERRRAVSAVMPRCPLRIAVTRLPGTSQGRGERLR